MQNFECYNGLLQVSTDEVKISDTTVTLVTGMSFWAPSLSTKEFELQTQVLFDQ